jgi:hypothetical protein
LEGVLGVSEEVIWRVDLEDIDLKVISAAENLNKFPKYQV